MKIQQDQQVTVRLLPDGAPCPATMDKLDGHLLTLDCSLDPRPVQLNAGDLVEVTSPVTVYLGIVRTRRDERATIAVEHALDRETLATIQQVWHGPADR
jgi:hypothetical protein